MCGLAMDLSEGREQKERCKPKHKRRFFQLEAFAGSIGRRDRQRELEFPLRVLRGSFVRERSAIVKKWHNPEIVATLQHEFIWHSINGHATPINLGKLSSGMSFKCYIYIATHPSNPEPQLISALNTCGSNTPFVSE